MKKTMLFLVILSATLLCFAGTLQVGVGADFNGKQKVKSDLDDNTWDVLTGMDVYGEYAMQSGMFVYGLGAEYEVPRTVKGVTEDGKVSFIPVYLVGKLQAPVMFKPELVVHVGYDFFMADDAYKNDADLGGGIYYAAGIAGEMANFVLQFMYKVNTGKVTRKTTIDTFKYDVTQNQLNVSLGYRF